MMEANRHLRSQSDPGPYQGICGAGHYWPSGVPLTNELARVTCPSCLEIVAKEAN